MYERSREGAGPHGWFADPSCATLPPAMPDLPRTEPEALFKALGARRLLIVSGKGGVGRTTVAALLGVALARRGRKVLVATTGHDDRLAWMLGAERLADTPVEVAPRLFIQRLDPSTCVEEYGALVTRSTALSHAVFGNKVVRKLLRAIPGLDDFAVLGKVWHEAVRARSFDVLIFDGPASGHLRLVLGVPQAIVETVAEGPLTREAIAMRDALQNPGMCQAVLVGLPEPWPLTELGELAGALHDGIGLHSGALVVNKLWPHGLPPLEAPPRELDRAGRLSSMFAAVERVGQRGREQAELVDAWLRETRSIRPNVGLVNVPWWPWGLDTPERLDEVLAAIVAGKDASGG